MVTNSLRSAIVLANALVGELCFSKVTYYEDLEGMSQKLTTLQSSQNSPASTYGG
jgi:hypothetical protein